MSSAQATLASRSSAHRGPLATCSKQNSIVRFNIMKTSNPISRWLLLASVTFVLALGGLTSQAQERQGRGNFDPEQFRQRMMERYREQLEVKNDDEWKIISERIDKVMQARRDVGFGGRGAFGRGPRGGDGDRDRDRGGDDRRFRGEPNPEVEALEKAIEAKASADELKAKVAQVRASRKDKEAKLAKAQDELKQVLSVRQEAIAVMSGLLN